MFEIVNRGHVWRWNRWTFEELVRVWSKLWHIQLSRWTTHGKVRWRLDWSFKEDSRKEERGRYRKQYSKTSKDLQKTREGIAPEERIQRSVQAKLWHQLLLQLVWENDEALADQVVHLSRRGKQNARIASNFNQKSYWVRRLEIKETNWAWLVWEQQQGPSWDKS